jgi:phosphoenolpyruvate carboxykinase (ATP)
VFNFEGGCYAKTIHLTAEAEPEIYQATHRFGTVLENVHILSDTRELDFADARRTENTRAAYPLHYMPNTAATSVGGHPADVVFLTADAFGVLPPVARLSPDQAMYHFLSGYTAKVAGTERGVTEPQATFSACFGAPFMAQRPSVYARLLGEKITEHKVQVWLINTGWNGKGERMKIAYTRAMVNAALNGELDDVPTVADPVFGVQIPVHCPNVPDTALMPKNSWDDSAAFEARATKLAGMFVENFKQFEANVSDEIKAAAPKVG